MIFLWSRPRSFAAEAQARRGKFHIAPMILVAILFAVAYCFCSFLLYASVCLNSCRCRRPSEGSVE